MRLAVEGRTYSTSPGLFDPTLLFGGLGSLGRVAGRLLGREATVVGERVLFEGGKEALRGALKDGIPGVNAAQAGAIRESLKEGSADLVKVATGENGLTTYFTRAGRDGHQTLVRMYDEAGDLKRMAQAAWDAVGRFVHGEVWK